MTNRFNSPSQVAYANPDLQSQLWRATAEQIQLMANRELARRRVLDFTTFTKRDFEVAAHHRLIARALDRVLSGECKRLIISMPPRHGKSELASTRFPALYLARNPQKFIIHASYAAELSNGFSRDVRALLTSDPLFKQLFPHVKLNNDRQRQNDWELAAGGGFFSIGVQGGVTGHGAHLFIIDDPMKEGDDLSLATMDDIFKWYASAAQTRLMPGGAVVIVMTRWHPLDLVGRLLDLAKDNPLADQWEVLTLPALAEADDPMGRKLGAALWPEWYPESRLHALRATDSKYFSALFQQKPRLADVQMFFEDRFILTKRTDMHHLPAVWTFDAATAEKEQADFSAMGRWRYDKASGDLLVSNARRMQKGWPYVKKLIKRLIRLYPNDKFVFPPDLIELLAVQDLRAEMPLDRARIVSIERKDYKGDKYQRAQAYADRAANGHAYVEPSRHARRFIAEHAEFMGAHDDFVDVSSVATHYFQLHKEFSWLIGQPAKEELSDESLTALAG